MRFSLLCASGFLLAGLCYAAEPIPPSQFTTLRALINPAADEDRWASIPWRTSLWQSREEAARLGKPILLWEMDGHPLGCT